MSAFSDYWGGLTPEQQERMHDAARNSILQLPRCPMDYDVVLEILAWQRVEIDVLEAHAAWLSRTRAKFERHGVDWTTTNVMRYSRLWEVE